jgi:hypothetical protein
VFCLPLHHLPDFWKQVTLLRMNRMLKTGGLLYIFDVVFDFAPEEYIPKSFLESDGVGRIIGDTSPVQE